jgi:hypothetical protein
VKAGGVFSRASRYNDYMDITPVLVSSVVIPLLGFIPVFAWIVFHCWNKRRSSAIGTAETLPDHADVPVK